MSKENIIEFPLQKKQQKDTTPEQSVISHELESAIENLIERLRFHGPVSQDG